MYTYQFQDTISIGHHWHRLWFTSAPLGQNGRHFTDDIFRCISANEKFQILIKIYLKSIPKGPNDNNPALVHLMNQCWPDLLTNICGTSRGGGGGGGGGVIQWSLNKMATILSVTFQNSFPSHKTVFFEGIALKCTLKSTVSQFGFMHCLVSATSH